MSPGCRVGEHLSPSALTGAPSLPPSGGRPAVRADGALILGGAHGSLAIARSLGRRGIPVGFARHDHPIVGYSRYTRFTAPWPGPNAPGAVDALVDLASRRGLKGWALFPGGDAEARLLAQHRDVLSCTFNVAAPPWSVAQHTYDKRLTDRHARALRIAAPLSLFPRSADALQSWSGGFPAILKPAVHDDRNAFTLAKAWRADDAHALARHYERAAALVGADAVVVQELIPGGGEAQFSYAGVWDRGKPVAALVARRTRQYPIDFGYTSTFVETVENPVVREAAERFLAALDYSGLVEIEFKHDARDGRCKLIDANGRIWAWAGIGTAAGLDFPHLAYRLAMGEKIEPQPSSRDAAWVHLARNVVAAVQEIAAGRTSLSALAPKTGRPLAYAAFAADDPLPGLVEMPLTLGRALRRRS